MFIVTSYHIEFNNKINHHNYLIFIDIINYYLILIIIQGFNANR